MGKGPKNRMGREGRSDRPGPSLHEWELSLPPPPERSHPGLISPLQASHLHTHRVFTIMNIQPQTGTNLNVCNREG